MKKKYILLAFILSLLWIDNVHAESCQIEIIRGFKNVENRYKVDYRYNVERESYTLILKHTKEKIYDYQIFGTKKYECEEINETTTECHDFNIGTYEYGIYGETSECKQTVKVGDIKIKELHNYSDDPLCKGIEEFALCQKDYYKDMDYDTFASRVNTYKKTKQEKVEEEIKKQEEQKTSTTKKINSYIEENLVQIIVVIVFIVLVIISVAVGYKTTRKSRRLE